MELKIYQEGSEKDIQKKDIAEVLNIPPSRVYQWKKDDVNNKKIELMKKGILLDKLHSYKISEIVNSIYSIFYNAIKEEKLRKVLLEQQRQKEIKESIIEELKKMSKANI